MTYISRGERERVLSVSLCYSTYNSFAFTPQYMSSLRLDSLEIFANKTSQNTN